MSTLLKLSQKYPGIENSAFVFDHYSGRMLCYTSSGDDVKLTLEVIPKATTVFLADGKVDEPVFKNTESFGSILTKSSEFKLVWNIGTAVINDGWKRVRQ